MLVNQEFWNEIERLIATSEVVVDRKKNSAHPRFPDFIYPVDYGFVRGTKASDGSDVDIWVGADTLKKVNGILCTIDPLKRDMETKIVYGCSAQEIDLIYATMNKVLRAIYISR